MGPAADQSVDLEQDSHNKASADGSSTSSMLAVSGKFFSSHAGSLRGGEEEGKILTSLFPLALSPHKLNPTGIAVVAVVAVLVVVVVVFIVVQRRVLHKRAQVFGSGQSLAPSDVSMLCELEGRWAAALLLVCSDHAGLAFHSW